MSEIIFILGRKAPLSIAEIISVLDHMGSEYRVSSHSTQWLTVDFQEVPDLGALQARLGGTIKIAEVMGKYISLSEFTDSDISAVTSLFSTDKKDRAIFGISLLGENTSIPTGFKREFGMSLKRYFESYGIKARFVDDKKPALSSVTFDKKIKDKGYEFLILVTSKGGVTIGKTLTAQDFEAYSKRDYGRPMVHKKSGSLPPKLAQVMVNLSACDKSLRVYDPFCGSGTVLQEAMVQGYDVLGSDESRKAIQQTKQNLTWLKHSYLYSNDRRYQVSLTPVSKVFDDKTLQEHFDKGQVGAIVAEPYLGPVLRSVIRKDKNYNYFTTKVLGAYMDLFSIAGGLLKKGMRLVLVVPTYKTTDGWETLEIADLYQKDFTKLDLLGNLGGSDFGDIDKDLSWDRPQSVVRREIYVLERK